jgi:hypothetical protein
LPAFLTSAAAYAQHELPVVGHLGGACNAVGVSGNLAVIGEGPLIRILDVSTPSAPLLVGQLPMKEYASVSDVWIQGSYAYVSAGDALRIVDISDPANPEEVGFSYKAALARSVSAAGNYAYIGNGWWGLLIIDATDPSNPIEVGQIDSPADPKNVGGITGIFALGSYVYICTTLGGLRIIDVSVPASPVEVGFCATPGSAYDVFVSGNYAYVASYGSGLRVIDISNPASPFEVGSYDTPGYARSVYVAGSYAYVADGYQGLRIIDVSNPSTPSPAGYFYTADDARKVFVSGNYAYVAAEAAGLRMIDVSNPASPSQVGLYNTAVVGNVQDVFESGAYAYVADDLLGLRVIDVSDPVHPSRVGYLDTPGRAYGVSVSGNYAYVAAWSSGLRVIDVSNPASPSEVGFIDTPGGAMDVLVSGAYAYVADYDFGLRVIDISTPASPTEVGSCDTPGTARHVAVSGNYAYVADTASGLRIIDVTNPTSPFEVGSYVPAGDSYIYGVAVSEPYAFLAADDIGLQILDISNPAAPTEVSVCDTPGYAMDVRVSGKYAYIADSVTGLRVIDIRDPQIPVEVGFYDVRSVWSGFDSLFVGNLAYLGDPEGGLFVIAIPPPAPDVDPLPPFINADRITVSGNALAGSFVTIGGGVTPVFQQLAPGDTAFSIEVELKQQGVNALSVATVNEYGLVGLPSLHRIVEGDAYPSTIETVTSLAVTPDPVPSVPLFGNQAFTCTATFSNAVMASVTQFVDWQVTNHELVTSGGLYVNTGVGAAHVWATIAGTFSNAVLVTDDPGRKIAEGVVAGRVTDALTLLGLPPPETLVRAYLPALPTFWAEHTTLDDSGNFAFLVDAGIYDLEGSAPGHRPDRQRFLPVTVTAPLKRDFALYREDNEPPLVTFIEPVEGTVVGAPSMGVTAIVYDRLTRLKEASLSLNGTEHDILQAISPEGFYRYVWPLVPGTNTFQIRAVDLVGNETLSREVTVQFEPTPLELHGAEAVSPVAVDVTFNGAAPGLDALNPSYYVILNSTSQPLAVSEVVRLSETKVRLTTEAQSFGETYTVSAYGIADPYGLVIRNAVHANFAGYDTSADADGDGLSLANETLHSTDPGNPDTDGDGMPDGWEVQYGLNPLADDANDDADGDGVANLQEYLHHTNPQNQDTDGDGLDDGAEVSGGTNPLRQDTDGDGMQDGWEVAHGLNPLLNDAHADADADGLSNGLEFSLGSDPNASDTDGDGLSDGEEYKIYGTNVNESDTDGDSVSDSEEVAHGSNPLIDERAGLIVTFPPEGAELRGDQVTIAAEVAGGGRVENVASALFEVKGPGTGDFWELIGTVVAPPFMIHWNADSLSDGAYKLHVVATSVLGSADVTPAETNIVISSSGALLEREESGVHTLRAPVGMADDNIVRSADSNTAVSLGVELPSGALNSNTTLRIEFPDHAGFDPVLDPREQDAGVYLTVVLENGQTTLANGKVATLRVSYPDTNLDGIVDGTTVPEDLLKLKYLNSETNEFDGILTTTVDTVHNTVTGTTNHLSVFALVGEVPGSAPLVATVSGTPDPTNSSPIPVSVMFSEPVSGFSVLDVTVSNATVTNFADSGSNYSFNLAPSGQGILTADIAEGVAKDSDGNGNLAAAQFARTYDSVAPTVSIGSVVAGLTNVSPIPVTVTFSEPVMGLTASEITVFNATAGNMAGSGADYSFELTPADQGAVTATMPEGASTDAAGNGNSSSAVFSRVYDSVPPTVSISPPSLFSTQTGPVTYLVTYEGADVVDLAESDVHLVATGTADGEVSVSAGGDPLVRTITIDKITGLGSLRVSIDQGTSWDDAGNYDLGIPGGLSTPFDVTLGLPGLSVLGLSLLFIVCLAVGAALLRPLWGRRM